MTTIAVDPEISPLSVGNVDRVIELLAATHAGENHTPETLERVIWRDPDFDPELCLVSTVENRVVGVAVGVRRAGGLDGAGPGFVKLLAVAPDHRRRGLGSELLGRLEAGLARRSATRAYYDGAAPAYFRPGLDATCSRGRAFLEKQGYRVVDERLSLIAELAELDLDTSQAEATLRASAIEVRRGTLDDADFLQCQIDSAFPADWAFEARLALEIEPAGLHLALRGGRLVGFAACRVSGPDVFGPMGTLPAQRGRGVGAVLLKRALRDIRGAGYERALINWVGPVEFYRRQAGPVEERRYLVLQKKLV